MKHFIIIVLVGILSISCVSDLDFDQAENIVVEPVALVSLLHFKVEGIDFPGSVGVELFEDVSEVHFFDTDFAEENVVEIIINFDLENTFNRNFTINYNFIDDNDVIIHTKILNVSANSHPLESDAFVKDINLRDILRTKKIAVEVTMDAGAPLNDDEFFHFQSAAKVYLHIQNNDD